MVMTFAEQQARYRRKLQRSAKLVAEIAKMTLDSEEAGGVLIQPHLSVATLNNLIMDARNIVHHQEG